MTRPEYKTLRKYRLPSMKPRQFFRGSYVQYQAAALDQMCQWGSIHPEDLPVFPISFIVANASGIVIDKHTNRITVKG